MTRSPVAVIAVTLVCIGCQSGWDMNDYRSAVRSGRPLISPSLEMEKQFPKTEHMLIMYGGTGSTQHEWQTVSFFGGRYELTMTINVILSSDGKKILKVVSEPKFYLSVCRNKHRNKHRGHSTLLTGGFGFVYFSLRTVWVCSRICASLR